MHQLDLVQARSGQRIQSLIHSIFIPSPFLVGGSRGIISPISNGVTSDITLLGGSSQGVFCSSAIANVFDTRGGSAFVNCSEFKLQGYAMPRLHRHLHCFLEPPWGVTEECAER